MRWSTTRCSRWTPSPSLRTDCRRESVRRERGHLPFINTDGYVDVGEGPPSATDQGHRAQRLQGVAARHPSGARVCAPDPRVPRRGRHARRRARGRDVPPRRLPLHLLAGRDDADALRHRTQLPAADPGHQRGECRGVRSGARHPSAGARPLYRRRRLRLRRHGGGGGDLPHRRGRRRLPTVVRAALGADRGRDLGVVLDPLLHDVLPSAPRRCTGSTDGCASCTCPRGHPAARSRSTGARWRSPDRGRSSATLGASARPRLTGGR